MNIKYKDKYLIKPREDGKREDTLLAIEYSDEQIKEMLNNGYFLFDDDDFQKLIGNAEKKYSIAMNGTIYETPPYIPSLDELKQAKINEFKNKRDTLEVEPIEYNGSLFDFDDKARDRINSAIIALDITKGSIEWTTADNTNVTVTANDLKAIVAAVAVRSNELHIKYRELKELVEACTTKEEVDKITWE